MLSIEQISFWVQVRLCFICSWYRLNMDDSSDTEEVFVQRDFKHSPGNMYIISVSSVNWSSSYLVAWEGKIKPANGKYLCDLLNKYVLISQGLFSSCVSLKIFQSSLKISYERLFFHPSRCITLYDYRPQNMLRNISTLSK